MSETKALLKLEIPKAILKDRSYSCLSEKIPMTERGHFYGSKLCMDSILAVRRTWRFKYSIGKRFLYEWLSICEYGFGISKQAMFKKRS